MEMQDFELTQDAVFLQLKYPAGPKKGRPMQDENGPVGLKIFGQDSAEFKKHQRRLRNRGIEAQTKKNAKAVDAEEVEDETTKTLAACIAEFVNISWKGETLKAPKDNELALEVMPWIIDQLDVAMVDRGLFMPALPKG